MVAERLDQQVNFLPLDLSKRSAFTPEQARGLLVWLQSLPLSTPLPLFPRHYLTSQSTSVHALKFSYGQSNPTFKVTLFDDVRQTQYCTLVMRAQPSGRLLPGAHRLDREYKVLEALWPTSVPVPRPYAFCADGAGVLPLRQFYIMQYVPGQIFTDLSMPELINTPADRKQVFLEALRVLVNIASVDIHNIGLAKLSRPSPHWLRRQVDTWYIQIERSILPDVDYSTLRELHHSLVAHPLYNSDIGSKLGLVHGDFRVDNLIFQRKGDGMLRCVAVLDWELVSLGDPLADFAQLVSPYYLSKIASDVPILKAMTFTQPPPPGIPNERDFISHYVSQVGPVPNLPIYIAVSLFRLSGVLCGVLARARQGNASSVHAENLGSKVSLFARGGLNALNANRITQVTDSKQIPNGLIGTLKSRDLVSKLCRFMAEHVLPLEVEYFKHISSDNRWDPWSPIETLKQKAKAEGMWNLFLPKTLGGLLSSAEYAPLASIMGRCVYASEVFNCSAPDTGNMELLARYGTKRQKDKWLKLLLDGSIRSCFGMTEPDVASSDATNLKTKVERIGDDYVINGLKWWTSGAMDPRCKLMLLVARGPGPQSLRPIPQLKHGQHTIVLVPMDAPGVKIIRHLSVFGFDDAPHGHAEVELCNVRLRASEALLHTEGGGFEAAQSRLGGGRLHHCMRLVGVAERSVEMMSVRAGTRSIFGKASMLQNDAVVQLIGECRCDVETMRAMVKAAAVAVDSGDRRKAQLIIGATKVAVPRMAVQVIDRAIQVHGGLGFCQDTVLGLFYAHARTLRIADGPDEVHLRNVAKDDVRKGMATSKL